MDYFSNDLGDIKEERDMFDHEFEREPENDIIIKRSIKRGEHPEFRIEQNGVLIKIFSFDLKKPNDPIWSESENLNKAKIFVDTLRNVEESETIIPY